MEETKSFPYITCSIFYLPKILKGKSSHLVKSKENTILEGQTASITWIWDHRQFLTCTHTKGKRERELIRKKLFNNKLNLNVIKIKGIPLSTRILCNPREKIFWDICAMFTNLKV